MKRRRFLDRAADEGRPAACQVYEMSPQETYAHQELRRIHCAQGKDAEHSCAGRVTIDAGGVTLQCELCGDARARNADEERRQ